MGQDLRDSIPLGDDGLMYDVKYAEDKPEKIFLKLSADNTQLGDGIGAQLMNQLAMRDSSGNHVATVVSQRDFYDSQMEYTHVRVGTVHQLSSRFVPVERTDEQGEPAATSDRIRLMQFQAMDDYVEGDTFAVDGVSLAAKVQGGGSELLDGFFVVGDLVSALLQSGEGGKVVFRSGGMPSIPSVFGDGSDGDLYIAVGETVVLPVLLPHRSVVERQYNSITIEAGGVLRCSGNNAGLILRCRRNCNIKGTVDQRDMSPKTNPANIYPYPTELICGAGGNGGYSAEGLVTGGVAMPARSYGGGYGAGGGGGSWRDVRGGVGGSTVDITTDTPDPLFRGGVANAGVGAFGGGGAGTSYVGGVGGNGGNGAGADGRGAGGKGNSAGGGAGNLGGGVILLYAGGECRLSGALLCSGSNGGAGKVGDVSYNDAATGGGGGGGGGGGAVYVMYNTWLQNTAEISVQGGLGGASIRWGQPGMVGGSGSVTIRKYVKEAAT